ncbi:MAG: hypothetical protein ACI8YQ_001437 [Polaribacter sp.]|jgi:hypothetical protein
MKLKKRYFLISFLLLFSIMAKSQIGTLRTQAYETFEGCRDLPISNSWSTSSSFQFHPQSGFRYWTNINYEDISNSGWEPQDHLERVVRLIEYYVDVPSSGLIRRGRNAMQSALEFAPYPENEGIQRDFSIHQHGPLLYNGGYGISFLDATGLWGTIVSGTPYAFEEESKERLCDFVLEGTRRMTIANATDYSANGRNIVRRYPENNTAVPLKVVDWIIGMADPSSVQFTELGKMRTSIFNTEPQYEVDLFEGNKYFWKSDYVTHHDANYFSTIKMCSNRTLGDDISGSTDLHTTINQSLYAGSHMGPMTNGGTQYVKHDGITYILPNNQSWDFYSENRTGGWNLIDDDCNPNNSNDDCPASGMVFKGFINHTAGANADSYYYIIAPGQPEGNYFDNVNPITELLPGNNDILAARKKGTGSDDLAGIVYFPDGSFPSPSINVGDMANQTNNPLELTVDGPPAHYFTMKAIMRFVFLPQID